MKGMTVREYALKEGITLGTAYRRIWEGSVKAEQLLGRWLILPESKQPTGRNTKVNKLTAASA